MKKFILLFISVALFINVSGQSVYHHISNTTVYDFLDEMASLQVIELNTVVKPYSRKFISAKLFEIMDKRSELNRRQQKELDFFIRDFKKEIMPVYNRKTDRKDKRYDILFYKDSLFTVSANPIGGMQIWKNDNGSLTHRWNGAEFFSYIGNWGLYASLRDNNETEILAKESYLTQRMGYENKGTGDYSEMRGGITYNWKWGTFGLVKDHFTWGTNYNGANIFGGRTPSFSQIKLRLTPIEWFEFNYVHAWLNSEVVDTIRSYTSNDAYGAQRDVMHTKYLAANMFTFKPFRNFNISFGNSIIYSDGNPKPDYLIPIFFYKSVDHTLNSADSEGGNVGQNSQMFLDISSRNIKKLHLYTSIFIDELSISRLKENGYKDNFVSFKFGFQLSNFVINNTFITCEYTKSKPLAYQHYVNTTTFESNGYNLGHYLKDNAEELYIRFDVKPLRGLHCSLSYLHAKRGPDYTALGKEGPDDGSRINLPHMESVEWEKTSILAKARYEIFNDVFVFGEIEMTDVSGDKANIYSPAFYQGKQTSISAGFNIGF